MKKKLAVIACLLSLGSAGTLAFAQAPTNTDYLRTMSMGAYDDGVSAALFNPAVTALFKDGFYAQVGNRFSFTRRTMDWTSRSASMPTTASSTLGPDAIFMYKFGSWALRLTMAAPDREGSALLRDAHFDNSAGTTGTGVGGYNQNLANYEFDDLEWEMGLGASFAFSRWMAISVDARMILDGSEYNAERLAGGPAGTTVRYSDVTRGAGIVGAVGIAFKPSDWFSISINGRTPSIVVRNHTVTGTHPLTAAINIASSDYSTVETGYGSVGLGMQFRVADVLRISADGIYNFAGKEVQTKGAPGFFINHKPPIGSINAGLGLDWQVKKWEPNSWGLTLGAGARYFLLNVKDDPYAHSVIAALRPLDDQIQVGAGLVYSPASFFDLSLSTMHAFRLGEPKAAGNMGGVKTNDWYANVAVTIKPGVKPEAAKKVVTPTPPIPFEEPTDGVLDTIYR